MAWLELPMKVVVSCVKLGVGADILWSQDCLMGLPKWLLLFDPLRIGNPLNWNILVGGGRESNSDIVSNGERKRCRTNWIPYCEVCGDVVFWTWFGSFFVKLKLTWNGCTVEGDSPVSMCDWRSFLVSWVGCIGYCVWIWVASTPNPKYISRPIAYLVPWGNAEKNPYWGVKRTWNQIVIARYGL